MAAVVEIRSFHGASPVGTSINNQEVYLKLADNDDVDLTNPIPRPVDGTTYSWAKYTKIYCVSGLSGQIGNIRWFADTAPEDWSHSGELYAGATSTYTQPSSADTAGQLAGTTNADNYISTTPLVVTSAVDAITTNASYGTQDYVRNQIGVLSTATSGAKTARRCVYRYDEV